MKCEKCGEDYPSKYYFKTETICNDCFEKLTSEEKSQAMKTDAPKSTSPTSGATPAESYKFKTLLGYGKVISGLGWVVAALGMVGLIGGLASGQEEGLLLAGGAFFGILLGIGMVASGQLITCFVSIENNTRSTYELLKQKQ